VENGLKTGFEQSNFEQMIISRIIVQMLTDNIVYFLILKKFKVESKSLHIFGVIFFGVNSHFAT
jgi:hypothetical protein